MTKVAQLIPSRMKLAEHDQVCYLAVVEQGVTRESLLDPTFWCHVANLLKPRFEIKVFCEDDTFYGRYLVVSCDKTWARVHELEFHDLNTSELSKDQREKIFGDYEIKFRGRAKWGVIRKADRALIQDGLHTQKDAEQWLTVHLNTQVGQAA